LTDIEINIGIKNRTINFYDIISNMDYVVGFLLGYFLKEAYQLIKRISDYDWNNRNYYSKAYYWSDYDYIDLKEDDLP